MRQMLSKVDLVDLYSLADPERCKEYLVVTSDALKKVFPKIKIYPKKGEAGTFYYQRLSAIRKRNPVGLEQESFCKDLAFFYIRIFQIFAAVALSILDTEVRDVATGEVIRAPVVRGPILQMAPAPGMGYAADSGSGLGAAAAPFSRLFRGGAMGRVSPLGSSTFLSDTFIKLPQFTQSKYVVLFNYLGVPYFPVRESALAYRGPLLFDGFSEMGLKKEDGVLAVDQDSLYVFGDEVPKEELEEKPVEAAAAAADPIAPAAAAAVVPPPVPSAPPAATLPAVGGGYDAGITSQTPGYEAFLDAIRSGLKKTPPTDPKALRFRRGPDDALKPVISYTFSRFGKTTTLEAVLQLEEKGNQIFITLSSFVTPQTLRVASDQVKQITLYRSGSSYSDPKDSEGRNMPKAIVNAFLEVFQTTDEGSKFSTIDFLQKIRRLPLLASQRDDPLLIDGTTITVMNPRSEMAMQQVNIRYEGDYKFQDGKKKAYIFAQLSITPKQRTVTQEGYSYIARIHFANATTKPESLRSYLTFPDRREAEFTASTRDGEPKSKTGGTIPKFLQAAFETIMAKGGAEAGASGLDDSGLRYTKDYMPIPYEAPGIPEDYKVKLYWEALRQSPPIKAHCVSRALQLLDAASILNRDRRTGESSVCDREFPLILNKSLPDPAGDVTSEVSISVLAHLFFDKTLGEKTNIAKKDEYRDFVRKLKQHFERLENIDKVDPAVKSLREVKDHLMGFCENNLDKKIVLKRGEDVAALRSVAEKLRDRQVRHLRAAVGILYDLFDKKSLFSGDFQLNQHIVAGGIDAVNGVAEKARRTLIQYFTDCEDTYKEGLFYLDDVITGLKKEGDVEKKMADRFDFRSVPTTAGKPREMTEFVDRRKRKGGDNSTEY